MAARKGAKRPDAVKLTAGMLNELLEAEVAYRTRGLREAVLDPSPDEVPLYEYPGRTPGWSVIGVEGNLNYGGPDEASPLAGWQGYERHHKVCRVIARENPFAINLLENYCSFVVGSGVTHTVAWDDEAGEPDEALVKKARSILREFEREQQWGVDTVEIERRLHRDGEVFIRGFIRPSAPLAVRFVEPMQVRPPQTEIKNLGSPAVAVNQTLGVLTEKTDAMRVVGYVIDGAPVLARSTEGFVLHFKANVDRNQARGISTLWAVRQELFRASGMLVKLSTMMDIRLALAMVRKHKASTPGQIERFASNRADYTVNKTTSGAVGGSPIQQFLRRYGAGLVLDTNENVDYVFPTHNINAADIVEGLQAVLRSVASRSVMPEHWLTSRLDAKYANALAAESPTVKAMERQQSVITMIDEAVIREALRARGMQDAEIDSLKITAVLPEVQVRDPKVAAEVNQILFTNAVLSRQTWSAMAGLDYDDEQQNIDDDEARNGGAGGALPAVAPEAPTPEPSPAPEPA